MMLFTVLATAFQALNLQASLHHVLIHVKSLGTVGIVAFIMLYNVATVLFVPACFLSISGGALYGVVLGSLYVIVAATLGAILAFGVGRYIARGWVYQQFQNHARLKALDSAVARDGLKIVLLTRLSPIFPFNALNYAFGLTCVPLKDYAIGSLGMIPGTVMYVYIGSLVTDIAHVGMPQPLSPQAQIAHWLIKILGFVATVMATLYIARIAQRSLQQTIPPSTKPPSSHDSLH